jgi:hypothetical protein
MTDSVENLEHRRALEIAREYEAQGYKVLFAPPADARPPFLADFRPDLIALSANDNVVVEVRSRSTLAGDRDLAALTRVVNATPGWRLDLIVTNPRSISPAEENADELSHSEIQARIPQVHTLLSSNQEDAAALLAWSTAEAALRLLAKQKNIPLENGQPGFIVKKLFSLGLLSWDDYQLMQESLRFRDLLVHGYRSPEPKAAVIGKLMHKIAELLQPGPEYSAA